jgi:dTDP-4-amino-4,6-dideoxygalactose transaminase
MSVNNKIWLSTSHLGEGELKYIDKAFKENMVSSSGSNIIGFEDSLQTYLSQNSQVVAVSSGTAAIHLALKLAGVTSTDEVLCQSFTFVASVNPILYQGATPILIDSERDTWNMCPIKLEEAILDRVNKKKKPKAIIVVHSYGMPAKIDVIKAIATKYDIILIEDAAEALGSSYKGQMCGTFGDYGVLSFNGNKIITTSGGGAVICKSTSDKERAIFLATQSKEKAIHYQHSEVGYNYRMSNISAGIGRGQMEVLDNRILSRTKMHNFYETIFKNTKGVTILKVPSINYISNYWLTCILIDESIAGFSKETLRNQLFIDDIESRLLWKPMHIQPLFSCCEYYGNEVSEKLFNTGLCLPSGSNITSVEKQRIKTSILKVLN